MPRTVKTVDPYTPPGTTVRVRRETHACAAGSLAELVRANADGSAVILVGHDETAELRSSLLEVVE